MTRRDLDAAVHAIARRQAGTFSAEQALTTGMSRSMMRRRVASGAWLDLDTDVFAVAASPPGWDRRCWAATLLHPSAALSHETAAAVLGLDGFGPGPVHVVVPPVGPHTSRLACVHRSRHGQIQTLGGRRVTSFAQVMVQLAARQPERALRGALHSGVHADAQRLTQVQDRVAALLPRRMPGMQRLHALVAELDEEPPTHSELERRTLEAFSLVTGMPEISRQVPAPWWPLRPGLVDFFIAAWSLIVEADGRRWHTRVDDFQVDRWRDAEAAVHGLHVIRPTWQLVTRQRAEFVDQLQRFAAARAA